MGGLREGDRDMQDKRTSRTRGQEDKRIRRKAGEGEQRIKQDNEDKLKKASPAYHWTEDSEPPCSENLMSAPCLVKVGGLSKTFICSGSHSCSRMLQGDQKLLPPYIFFRLVAKDCQVPLILVTLQPLTVGNCSQ